MNWLPWAVLSAFFAGITAILAKKGVEGVDSNLATAVRTSVVVVFSWLMVLVATPADARSLSGLSRRTWVFLVLSGLATGLSWLCYFRALQLGPASRVAPVDKLSVVFAILLAVLVLHEKLAWHHWLGGSLILLGALLLAWK
jgi:transporter family protein